MEKIILYINQNLNSLITILLALLAGMIALYQVKLNIISSARIKWIESLRELISEYCMEISNCNYLKLNLYDEKLKLKDKSDENLKQFLARFYEPYVESARKGDKLNSKIMLYLNSENKKQNELELLLMENIKLIKVTEKNNRKELDENLTKIILCSKKIFSSEWNKSRRIFKL